MSEKQPDRSGGENPGVDADVAGRGDEGRRTADSTPPIGQDADRGQTQVPAAEEDVGVPPDDEMGREPEQ